MPPRCGRQLLMSPWQLSSSLFLIIIILFGEINVPGQSIIQPVKSDVNSLLKINCRLGKGSQPFLARLSALPNPHQSLSGRKKRTGLHLQLRGEGGRAHLSGAPNGAQRRCCCLRLHAILREGGLVFNIIIIILQGLWVFGLASWPHGP